MEAWTDPETGLSVSSYQKGYWAGSSGSASFWGEDSQASAAPVAQSLPGPYACVIPGHGNDDGYHDDPDDDNDDSDPTDYLESYTYRADNMLVGYEHNQAFSWTYTYDALNRRVSKEKNKEHGRPAYETWQRDETTYLGLSDTILRDSTEWKTWKTHVSQNALDYLVGPGGRAYGAEEAYWWRGYGYGNHGYAEDRFYHYDIRGSLSAITFDKPGLSGTRLEYDAFGNLEGGSFNASFQWQGLQHSVWETVGYAGQRYDRESGLYAYKYRSYDPELGQWMQEDPIRAGEAWYEFCAGNPVRFTDPTGLAPVYPGNPYTNAILGATGTERVPDEKIAEGNRKAVGIPQATSSVPSASSGNKPIFTTQDPPMPIPVTGAHDFQGSIGINVNLLGFGWSGAISVDGDNIKPTSSFGYSALSLGGFSVDFVGGEGDSEISIGPSDYLGFGVLYNTSESGFLPIPPTGVAFHLGVGYSSYVTITLPLTEEDLCSHD